MVQKLFLAFRRQDIHLPAYLLLLQIHMDGNVQVPSYYYYLIKPYKFKNLMILNAVKIQFRPDMNTKPILPDVQSLIHSGFSTNINNYQLFNYKVL
jgi:hypothetical protein